MEDIKKQCPEFPHFGASYPDATCINGYLWDLDKCTDDGGLYSGGDDPCPFCNVEEYIDWACESGLTTEEAKAHIEILNKNYNS